MKLQSFILLIVYLLSSCSMAQRITYLQDVEAGNTQAIVGEKSIKVRPGDMLSIIVSSKDPQLAAMFNLPRVQQAIGNLDSNNNRNGQVSGYVINPEGYIDFPVLGPLYLNDLTRDQVAVLIKTNLAEKELLKDAVVTVDFLNLSFSVMGEVARPGQFRIDKDRVNILEALSMAGDLTIYGKRDGIVLIREIDRQRTTYTLDIRTSGIYESPAFYVQQNDLIYVQPNNVRANQSTVNANNLRSVSLWMSVASFLTTIGVLIFK